MLKNLAVGLVLLSSPASAQGVPGPDTQLPAVFRRLGVVEFGISSEALLRQRPALRPGEEFGFREVSEGWLITYLFAGAYAADASFVLGGLEEVVASRPAADSGGVALALAELGGTSPQCFSLSSLGGEMVWAYRRIEGGTVRGIYLPADTGRYARTPARIILRWTPGSSLPEGARMVTCPW